MKWIAQLVHWYNCRTKGVVQVDNERVIVCFASKTAAMRWQDIVRIEVGRKPTITVETFYVFLFDAVGKRLKTDDIMHGFADFAQAVFAQWPEAEQRWNRVYNGAPDESEHAVVWRTDERSY